MSVIKVGPSHAYLEKYGGAGDGAPLFQNAIVLSSPQEVAKVFSGPKCTILIYWTRCGHCHKFAPTYDAAAERYGKILPFYVIEVSNAEPRDQLPDDEFFQDGGVPRVAAVEEGVVIDKVKGDNASGFMAMLQKLVTPV
jgi:thiol-disulfide isomerase/thioredoxin